MKRDVANAVKTLSNGPCSIQTPPSGQSIVEDSGPY